MKWNVGNMILDDDDLNTVKKFTINGQGEYVVARMLEKSFAILGRDGEPFGKPFEGWVRIDGNKLVAYTLDGTDYVSIDMFNRTPAMMSQDNIFSYDADEILGVTQFAGRDWMHVKSDGVEDLVNTKGMRLMDGMRIQEIKETIRVNNKEYLHVKDSEGCTKLVDENGDYLLDKDEMLEITGVININGVEYLQTHTENEEGNLEFHLHEGDGAILETFEEPVQGVVRIAGEEWYAISDYSTGRSIVHSDGRRFGEAQDYDAVARNGIVDETGKPYVVILDGVKGEIGTDKEKWDTVFIMDEEGNVFGSGFDYTLPGRTPSGRDTDRHLCSVKFEGDQLRIEWSNCYPAGRNPKAKHIAYMSKEGDQFSNESDTYAHSTDMKITTWLNHDTRR